MLNIFLVEDSLPVRERLRSMLSEIPSVYVNEWADSEEEAVAGIIASRPDLVVLDIHLKSGNGLGVLRRVKAEIPDLKVMMITNLAHPQYRCKCEELGVDWFLDKSREFAEIAKIASLTAAASSDQMNKPDQADGR